MHCRCLANILKALQAMHTCLLFICILVSLALRLIIQNSEQLRLNFRPRFSRVYSSTIQNKFCCLYNTMLCSNQLQTQLQPSFVCSKNFNLEIERLFSSGKANAYCRWSLLLSITTIISLTTFIFANISLKWHTAFVQEIEIQL